MSGTKEVFITFNAVTIYEDKVEFKLDGVVVMTDSRAGRVDFAKGNTLTIEFEKYVTKGIML